MVLWLVFVLTVPPPLPHPHPQHPLKSENLHFFNSTQELSKRVEKCFYFIISWHLLLNLMVVHLLIIGFDRF